MNAPQTCLPVSGKLTQLAPIGLPDRPAGAPLGYFACNCSRPSRPSSTSYGAAFSGWYSKRARSKYCVRYALPSVGLISTNSSVSGKPCCANPPFCCQYWRKRPQTILPVSGNIWQLTAAAADDGAQPASIKLARKAAATRTLESLFI